MNEETLSSLALKPGDAIIDVDHKPVTSVSDTTAFLFKNLKEKGYVCFKGRGSVNCFLSGYDGN